jgi:hypothetical protein
MWKKWLKFCGKAIVQYAPKIAEIVVDLLTKKKPEPSA